MDELLADFLTETQEGLVALDQALLRLERNPTDAATLGEVFRIVHTVKGTCGFLALSRLESVAHAAENVLGRARDGALRMSSGVVTLVLGGIDRIKLIVNGLEATGEEPKGDDAALIAALNAVADGQLPAPPEPAAAAPAAALPAAAPPGQAAPIVAGAPAPARLAPPSVAAPPPAVAPAPLPAAPSATAASPEPAAAGEGNGAPAQTIRVSVEVLEGLMRLVSELVLTRNQLNQLGRNEAYAAFAVPLQRVSQITSELQEGVMKTRMQPIGNAWAKLPRLVRDLSMELGKRIELEMKGAETELDRQVLELIKDPLTHMVRNSGDHGLETPEQRRAAGKPETGRITLNAYHEGGCIMIELADDGRGLSTDRIRAKVLGQGLTTEAELAGMSEREIHRFIFRAGFSTAAQITAVSGRGVGMDVVKTNLERIGGTIELRSQEGRGTTFIIKIPLTLAIVAALIVEAGGERFAMPQIGVVELVRLGSGGAGDGAPRLERIKDTPVLRLRDRLLPVVPLSGLLQLDKPPAEGDGGFVLVTQVGNQLFGIMVDQVFDTEEIVVKPVAPILRHLTVFSGNTILGDGSVIMILDPNGIARATGISGEGASGGAMGKQSAPAVSQGAEAVPLLLFRAGDGAPKAVPLGLVARLEMVPRDRIETAGGKPVVQYRGQLMPLAPLVEGYGGGADPGAEAEQAVLVFGDNGRALGLMVDAILDVVQVRLTLDRAGQRPGFLGTLVVDGKVTEVIDTAWWLRHASDGDGDEWFGGAGGEGPPARILVVEDSRFFRDLVIPALTAAGFAVVAAADAEAALRLRDADEMFDAVISDITMPGMDGFALASAIRRDGPWAGLPLIALSARRTPADLARGRAVGFTDYVGKYDQAALLDSLRQCLSTPTDTMHSAA